MPPVSVSPLGSLERGRAGVWSFSYADDYMQATRTTAVMRDPR
jgi:hypothetical protein